MSNQNYGNIWDLLKEARDEADLLGHDRISEGIEILLELINHRQTKYRPNPRIDQQPKSSGSHNGCRI